MLLEKAVESLLQSEGSDGKLLYSIYYEQHQNALPVGSSPGATGFLDLAFDDGILDEVKSDWMKVSGNEADDSAFLRFEERLGMNEEDDDNDNHEY